MAHPFPASPAVGQLEQELQAQRIVADVTQVLRAARERAGWSLEDLSARTKIKVTFLEALEAGEFSRLPGEFFTRAFLRTCARELGLSPDAVVGAYDAERRSAEPTAAAAEPEAESVRRLSGKATQASLPTTRRLRLMGGVAAVLMVGLAVALMRSGPHATRQTGQEPDARVVGTSGVAAAAGDSATPSHRPGPEGLIVEIRTTDLTWLAATSDGRRVAYRLFQPDEHLVLEASESLSLRIGNAAAVEYTINGEPGITLGSPGAVRTLQITRANVETFKQ